MTENGKLKAGKADRAKNKLENLKMLEALERAAAAIGVEVRYNKLAEGDIKSTSGSCKIRGVSTIIVDRRLGTRERIIALARELQTFDLEKVFMPPALRKLVETRDEESGGVK